MKIELLKNLGLKSFKTKFKAFFSHENNFRLKFWISIYTVLTAIYLTAFKDNIFPDSKRAVLYLWDKITFQETPSYPVDWWTFFYWLLLLLWVFCYLNFVKNEAEAAKKSVQYLEAAIFKSPNPLIYKSYTGYFNKIINVLNTIDQNFGNADEKFSELLEQICFFTSDFMRQEPSSNTYGANIMLFIPSTENSDLFDELKKKEHRWKHFRDISYKDMYGILYLNPNLSYKVDKDGKKEEDILCLPLRKSKKISEFKNFYLPGAPKTAITNDFVFFDKVRDKKHYMHLEDPEQKIGEDYWKKDTLKEIESIISLPISLNDHKNDPVKVIGVLNINSKKTDVFGSAIEYRETFSDLMYPIAFQIAPLLKKYVQYLIPYLRTKFSLNENYFNPSERKAKVTQGTGYRRLKVQSNRINRNSSGKVKSQKNTSKSRSRKRPKSVRKSK